MSNKFFNLFVRESSFRSRAAIIFISAFLGIYAWNRADWGSIELKKLEHEKMLTLSISAMEQELKDIESRQLSRSSDSSGVLPVINGIWIQDNSPVALAGDNLLKEGDSIGQYIISKITERKVILTDKLTNLTKEIDF